MFTFKKPRRRVTKCYWHCSASDYPQHDDISVMEEWHRARRFNGVGYHGFGQKNGNFQAGRSLERAPAAQAGHNSGSLAYCLHGLDINKFTDAQYDLAREMVKVIDKAYNGRITFHGHTEVAAKSCPVFGYKGILNLDGAGNYLGDGYIKRPNVEIPTDGRPTDKWPAITLHDTGAAVVKLQRALNIAGAFMGVNLKTDGIFGNKTADAVIEFKREHGLYPSPVVKDWVWKTLLSATDPHIGKV